MNKIIPMSELENILLSSMTKDEIKSYEKAMNVYRMMRENTFNSRWRENYE